MNLLERANCPLCHQPAGMTGRCCCPADCGDLMCHQAPLPADDATRPPLPVFAGTTSPAMDGHDGAPTCLRRADPSTGSGATRKEPTDA